MDFLYQVKNIFLGLALINLPYARAQGVDDIIIKGPPTAPATYSQCRDYCTLSGIRNAGCIANQTFYDGDWSMLTASDWACLCDHDHYIFYSVIVGRSCGVWPVCGPVSSQISLEYRDNCTAAAQRYNGTKPPTTATYTGWPSTESPPYPTTTFPGVPTTPPTTVYFNSSQSSYGNSSSSPTLTMSTAFTKIFSTVTSCPAPPNGCSIGKVITSTSALYTTTCPILNSVAKTSPVATSQGASDSSGTSSGSSGAAGSAGGAGSGLTITTGKPVASTSTGKPATTSSVLQAAGAPMFEKGWSWALLSTVMVGLFAFAEL